MLKSVKLKSVLLSVSFLTTMHVTAFLANGQSTSDPLVTEEAANWMQREIHILEKERDQLLSKLGESHQAIKLYDKRLERWSSFLKKYSKPSPVQKPENLNNPEIVRLEDEINRVLHNKERVQKHLEVTVAKVTNLELVTKRLREADEEKLAHKVDEKLGLYARDIQVLEHQLVQMDSEISELETLIREQRIKNRDAILSERIQKETTHEQ